jgi:hypothetical protein
MCGQQGGNVAERNRMFDTEQWFDKNNYYFEHNRIAAHE